MRQFQHDQTGCHFRGVRITLCALTLLLPATLPGAASPLLASAASPFSSLYASIALGILLGGCVLPGTTHYLQFRIHTPITLIIYIAIICALAPCVLGLELSASFANVLATIAATGCAYQTVTSQAGAQAKPGGANPEPASACAPKEPTRPETLILSGATIKAIVLFCGLTLPATSSLWLDNTFKPQLSLVSGTISYAETTIDQGGVFRIIQIAPSLLGESPAAICQLLVALFLPIALAIAPELIRNTHGIRVGHQPNICNCLPFATGILVTLYLGQIAPAQAGLIVEWVEIPGLVAIGLLLLICIASMRLQIAAAHKCPSTSYENATSGEDQVGDQNADLYDDIALNLGISADNLSPQEARVVKHLLEGKSSKISAIELGVAHSTIRNLRARAYKKLGVSSARDLMHLAQKSQEIPLESNQLVYEVTNDVDPITENSSDAASSAKLKHAVTFKRIAMNTLPTLAVIPVFPWGTLPHAAAHPAAEYLGIVGALIPGLLLGLTLRIIVDDESVQPTRTALNHQGRYHRATFSLYVIVLSLCALTIMTYRFVLVIFGPLALGAPNLEYAGLITLVYTTLLTLLVTSQRNAFSPASPSGDNGPEGSPFTINRTTLFSCGVPVLILGFSLEETWRSLVTPGLSYQSSCLPSLLIILGECLVTIYRRAQNQIAADRARVVENIASHLTLPIIILACFLSSPSQASVLIGLILACGYLFMTAHGKEVAHIEFQLIGLSSLIAGLALGSMTPALGLSSQSIAFQTAPLATSIDLSNTQHLLVGSLLTALLIISFVIRSRELTPLSAATSALERSTSRRDQAETFLRKRRLNDTQIEVAILILAGLPQKEIAQKLCMAPGTVNSARRAVYSALGIHSKEELACLIDEASSNSA